MDFILPTNSGKNKPGYPSIKKQFIELVSGTKFSDLHPSLLKRAYGEKLLCLIEKLDDSKEEVKRNNNLNGWDNKWEKNRLGFAKWITSKKTSYS